MKKILFSIFALAALCCCTKIEDKPGKENAGENDQQEILNPAADPAVIVCQAPLAPATSTATSGDSGEIPVIWLEDDQVKVYGENFTDGVVYTTATDGERVEFTAASGVTDPTRYAIYPAGVAGTMSAGTIPVDLSRFRSYEYHSQIPFFGDPVHYKASDDPLFVGTDSDYFKEHSIFPHLPMFSSSTSDQFTFSNLFGGLKVNLNDYQGNAIKIASIKLTADKYISGTMNVASDGSFTLTGSSEDEKTITVYSASGIKISPSDYAAASPNLNRTQGKFYFFLPAGTYSSLTFTLTDTSGRIYTQSVSSSVTVTAGIVKTFKLLQLSLYYGTTNCYKTTTGQTVDIDITPYYTFDTRFRRAGNVVEGTLPTLTPSVLWELKTDATALEAGSVISGSPTIVGNTMSVTIGSNTGNAVVAVKDGDDVMWSWHIWVVENAVADIHYKINGEDFYMMDRDLGAVWGCTPATKSAPNAYRFPLMVSQHTPRPVRFFSTISLPPGLT